MGATGSGPDVQRTPISPNAGFGPFGTVGAHPLPATVRPSSDYRAAANNVVKAAGAAVYVSSRPDMPGVLLFSRVPLSGRQGKNNAKER